SCFILFFVMFLPFFTSLSYLPSIFPQTIPRCGCPSLLKADDTDDDADEPDDVFKPDIVFFGEKLSDDFDQAVIADRDQVDLLVAIGSSLQVHPVAGILSTSLSTWLCAC